MNSLKKDLRDWFLTLQRYTRLKITKLARRFEKFKNKSVDLLMWRRGSLQKHVWHGSMIGLALIAFLTSGMFGGQTLVSATYPGVGGPDPRFIDSFEPFPNGPIIDSAQGLETAISEKPRSEIIKHEVEEGDTISSIAKKYGVTQETVKWANDLTDVNTVKPGQTLKILPVSGVAVTVKSGETVDSLAKKYQADAQAIVDFPFNDVPDDFKLSSGQDLIIPDGQPPEVKAPPKPKVQPQYLAQGPSSPTFSAANGGGFVWPATSQGISTYFAWWHPGIDLPNRSAPPVVASDGGKVVVAGWPDSYGYGNRVVIDHGNGYRTLYAHLSNIYVSNGQSVVRGQKIGQMGNTGRSTGTHLHFEIHLNGRAVNPLSILK
jgi:murein DD-endopeptidase MepM/ murein hydrolase activator NlpD